MELLDAPPKAAATISLLARNHRQHGGFGLTSM